MTVAQQGQNTQGNVSHIEKRKKGESLFQDSMRRLRRNRLAVIGLIIIIITIFVAIFASQLAPRPYDRQDLTLTNSVPRWIANVFPNIKLMGEPGGFVNEVPFSDYPLGTDNLGRDILSRLIYGTRISLAVAFIGPIVAIFVGMSVGLISGYVGGRIDNILMRFVDLMYAFPTVLLIILMLAVFRSIPNTPDMNPIVRAVRQADASMGGLLFVFIGIGLTSWMDMARLVRGQVLSVREKEFVQAANSLGANTRGILFRHILPNILGPVVVSETLAIPRYISYEAFLSFIGLGVNPPTPSWGSMIAEGARSIGSYPYQALFPALVLAILMFAFNFLGDGLRDALDPRMRGVD